MVQVPSPDIIFLLVTDMSRQIGQRAMDSPHQEKGLSGDLHVDIFQVCLIFIQVQYSDRIDPFVLVCGSSF